MKSSFSEETYDRIFFSSPLTALTGRGPRRERGRNDSYRGTYGREIIANRFDSAKGEYLTLDFTRE